MLQQPCHETITDYPRYCDMSTLACIAEVLRANRLESLHMGAVAVVNTEGTLLYHAGDAHMFTFTRSTLKPFQAAPLVRAGGLEKFGFSTQQTALLCASHSGESAHVAQVQSMLDAIGYSEADLRCGCHAPIYAATPAATAPNGPNGPFNQLHNNCSGKHAGFLAYCALHSLPIEDYIDPDHPLQQAVRHSVSHFCQMDETALAIGIDGCSAPNYAMPLSHLAYAYARLAQAAEDAVYGDTLIQLFEAMTQHPEMVSGTGRFDLALMQASPGDWVAKGGAEGVQAIGIRSAGLGIAIKVADGNARALYPAAVATLAQLGLLGSTALVQLSAWAGPQLTNVRGLPTGEVRACVQLRKA
jgi:L-asparaginase II